MKFMEQANRSSATVSANNNEFTMDVINDPTKLNDSENINNNKPNLQFRRRSSTMRPGTSDDPSTAAAYVAAQKNSKRK
jgi:hypothetical protein